MIHDINKKTPEECTSITDVRNEIDNIDWAIINLLYHRFQYVKEVVKYKEPTSNSIEASDRRTSMLQTRRQWAEQAGLSPDVIENMFDNLVEYFISEEKKIVNIK